MSWKAPVGKFCWPLKHACTLPHCSPCFAMAKCERLRSVNGQMQYLRGPFCHWAFIQGFPLTLKSQFARPLSFPLCFLNPRNAPSALCLEQEISIAVPGVEALMAVGAGSILSNPAEKVWTLNLSCCYSNAGGFCVCLCIFLAPTGPPLSPLSLPPLPPFFLVSSSGATHAAFFLDYPLHSSAWFWVTSPHCLSSPIHFSCQLGFNNFFWRRSSSLCCLILSLNSFNTVHEDPKLSSLCSSPFPLFHAQQRWEFPVTREDLVWM